MALQLWNVRGVMSKKIFIQEIADKLKARPEDVLRHMAHLAENNNILATVPNVTLSTVGDAQKQELELEAMDIPLAVVRVLASGLTPTLSILVVRVLRPTVVPVKS